MENKPVLQELNIKGPKDMSIFSTIEPWCIILPEQKERVNRFVDLYGHIKDLEDHRLLTIIGALVIENCIDDLMTSFMPGYNDLKNNRDVTFSLKIEILKSFRIIPSRILSNADLIRSIRNDFAHNLKINNLEQLESKKIKSIEQRVKEYWSNQRSESNIFEYFFELVHCTFMAIHMYTSHVSNLSEFIRNKEEFLKPFKKYCIKKGGIDIDAYRRKKPNIYLSLKVKRK